MLHRAFGLGALTKWFYWICIVRLVHLKIIDYDGEVQRFSSSKIVAGLQHSQSRITLCSGSFYSSVYVFTSCRCLYSYIAVYPFFKARNASDYHISIVGENETDFEVSRFVMHPYCMQVHVMKPYKNNFGLVVLKNETDVPPAIVPLRDLCEIEDMRQQLIFLSNQSAICVVLGHHTASGIVEIGTTKMILMTTADCLFRLCIPKIGCDSKRAKIAHQEDFCLHVAGDARLGSRFLQGSSVLCDGHVFGIVVSTGSPRYPQVPTTFAALPQFLTNFAVDEK